MAHLLAEAIPLYLRDDLMDDDKAEDFTGGQFQNIIHDAQKRLLRKHQENEWTAVSKSQEGYCYVCLTRDWCIATLIDVCYPCAKRRGTEPILRFVKGKEWGFCDVHGNYPRWYGEHYHIVKLNVRVCRKCTKKITEGHRDLRRKGVHNVDPFYKFLKKKLGNDYRLIGSELGGSVRR